ncbi:hypothetical protein VPH35_058249 [Triticum aestivum]
MCSYHLLVSSLPSGARFSDLTGIDYSEAAIELARNLAILDGFEQINFLVDDILEIKLERGFELVMDEGTLDAIGLHPDGPVKRMMYWQSVASLVYHGGILMLRFDCHHWGKPLTEVDRRLPLAHLFC